MPLADWQAALGTMVVTAASDPARVREAPDSLRLTPDERAWLDRVADSRGLAVTARIQRWWREVRLRWAARLTLAVLDRGGAVGVLDAYLSAVPAFSLFLVPEAVQFLAFAPDAAPGVPHLAAVARFERALLETGQPGAPPEEVIVPFDAPPEDVLDAVLFGRPLPPPDGGAHRVAVSAALPGRWQVLPPDPRPQA